MKPNFALNLSHEGITLLHRATAGWLRIGSISLDDPDLTDELQVLRKTATDLESSGLSTKLVIPNSQILYTEVDAPGPDTADRIGQIRDGLVGLTPYDVNDLVFDWRMNGKRAQVAVVARDTLREAESFATEYRFNPVSFVATPENGTFDGEPFFGPTKHAGTFLSDGETVQPDTGKIAVLGATTAAAEAAPKRKKKKSASRKKTATKPKAEASAQPETETAAVKPNGADLAGAMVLDTPVAGAKARDTSVAAETAPPPEPAEAAPALSFASRRGNGSGKGTASAAKPPLPLRAELPPVDAPEPEPKKTKKPLPPPPPRRKVDIPLREDILDDVPPMPAGMTRPIPGTTAQAARAPLTTGRKSPYPLQRPATTTPITEPTTRRVIPPLPPGLPGTRKDKDKDAPGFLSRLKRAPKDTGNGAPAPAAALPTEAQALTVFGARTATVGGKPRFLGLFLTLLLLAALAALALWSTYFMDDLTSGWVEDLDEEVAVVQPDTPVADPGGAITSAPLDEPATDGGAVLLTDEPVPEDTAPQGVDVTAPDQPAGDGTIETALLDAPDETVSEPSLGTSDAPDLPATDPAVSEPVAEVTPPAPVRTDPLTQAEAETRYAVTGIWQKDPPPLDSPGLGRLDDLFIASVDPQLPGQQQALLALPSPAEVARDARLVSPTAPPPLGTQYDFDDRGLIRATPGGSVTPEGTLIFLGEPPAAPGPRPTDLRAPRDDSQLEVAPQTDTAEAPAAEPEAETAAAQESETDITVAAPETTSPEDGAEAPGETAVLQDPADGETDVARLSQVRPALRPATPDSDVDTASLGGIAPSALEDRPGVRPLVEGTPETPTDGASDETAETEARDEADGTEQAVTASLLPRNRPADFAETVERAQEAARADTPEPSTESTPQPREETEVAAARVPDIPTSTSVAEQATERNAINLRRVNLIGVYGTPARRSALVRLPSGRFVKVEVGDRVDGGRVAAIGDDELRYVKGGRNITLTMPNG